MPTPAYASPNLGAKSDRDQPVRSNLILRNRRVDFVRPSQDAALEIPYLAESRLLQKFHRLGGTLTAAAVRHDFSRTIELTRTFREFTQRNEMAIQVTNLELVRLTDIENKKIIATIEPGFQFARGDLGNTCSHGNVLLSADSAEFFVIHQFVNRRMVTANRAIGISAQAQFTEAHAQRVEQQQAAGKRFAGAKNQLDRLHGLERAHNSGKDAQHATFCAGRHKSGRRWFRIQAAVAGSALIMKDGALAFEAEDRAVNVGLIQQHARIID